MWTKGSRGFSLELETLFGDFGLGSREIRLNNANTERVFRLIRDIVSALDDGLYYVSSTSLVWVTDHDGSS